MRFILIEKTSITTSKDHAPYLPRRPNLEREIPEFTAEGEALCSKLETLTFEEE